jgi:hypothetical protein
MSGPQRGDLIIRCCAASSRVEFVIVEAVTHLLRCGPFASLREATIAALDLAGYGYLWHDSVDAHGRLVQAAVRVPFRPRHA